MTVPPTRILSWQQLVLEADPNFQRGRLQPWVYQFSNNRLFYAPVGLYEPLPSSNLINNGGFLMLDGDTAGYPVSDAGLQPGQLWSNATFICGIPGVPPQAGAPPIFFGQVTATQVLLAGLASLPVISPESGSEQLWFNDPFVCVA